MIRQGAESNAMLVKSITHYNSQIATRLKTFKNKNSGVKGIVVDTSVAFKKAIKSPQNYGAPDALCYNADGKSCVSQILDYKICALKLE
jgi:phospholipase/lecithinase/hemolysin